MSQTKFRNIVRDEEDYERDYDKIRLRDYQKQLDDLIKNTST